MATCGCTTTPCSKVHAALGSCTPVPLGERAVSCKGSFVSSWMFANSMHHAACDNQTAGERSMIRSTVALQENAQERACCAGILHAGSGGRKRCVLQQLVRSILANVHVARASALLGEHDQCLQLCNLRMPGKIAAQLNQGCLTSWLPAVLKHQTAHGHVQLIAVYRTLVTWIPFRSCGPTCAGNRSRASRIHPGPWPTSSSCPAVAACTFQSNTLHVVLT